jgi:hypothetical protein
MFKQILLESGKADFMEGTEKGRVSLQETGIYKVDHSGLRWCYSLGSILLHLQGQFVNLCGNSLTIVMTLGQTILAFISPIASNQPSPLYYKVKETHLQLPCIHSCLGLLASTNWYLFLYFCPNY